MRADQEGVALPGPCSTTPSATCRIDRRRSIAVFWIHRKASGSAEPELLLEDAPWRGRPPCGSPATRRGRRPPSRGRPARRSDSRAISIAGTRSVRENGLTRYAIAPASRARSTRSRWENAVRMTTGAMRAPAMCSAAAMPSRTGILTSVITRSGRSCSRQLDRLLAVGGLADDLVALLGQHLGEVHADQGLVLGDDHAAYGGSGVGVGLRHGRKASPIRFAPPSRVGGMADAMVSNTIVRKDVWVRIPHPAPMSVVYCRLATCPTCDRSPWSTRPSPRRTPACATPTTPSSTASPSRRSDGGAGSTNARDARAGRRTSLPRARGATAPSSTRSRTPSCWAGTSATGISPRAGDASSTCTWSTTASTPC